MAVKFILGFSNSYVESYYTNNLKVWPDCLETAYLEATKYKPTRAADHSPTAMERANAFAMTRRGGKGGRGGYPGRDNGKSAPNAKWVKDGADSPEGGKNKKVAAYTASKSPPAGCKRGPCNNCGKYGHLAYECRGEPADTHVEY